jgi:hypothetical protein
MTVQHVTDMKTPIGEILKAVGPEGALLEPSGDARYAVIPLDDDLIDYLIERNPTFIKDCGRIREQMRAGQFQRHDEVKKLLTEGPKKRRRK